MTQCRGVIFDKDGTLFDFSLTWVSWAERFLDRIAPDRSHVVPLGKAIGFDVVAQQFDPDSVAIAGTPTEIADALVEHLDTQTHAAIVDIINDEATQAPQAEAVPLQPFLAHLVSLGLKLGVVTNDAESPARTHLESVGALRFFDFIAGFDSGYGAKPGPGQLRAFAAATDLAPEQILMVGDSLHDLMAARAAGMRAVGVLTGLATERELAPHAVAVLQDIGLLPDWLSARNLLAG